jgi:hypothetical protein
VGVAGEHALDAVRQIGREQPLRLTIEPESPTFA